MLSALFALFAPRFPLAPPACPRARIFPGFSVFSEFSGRFAVPGSSPRTALCRFGPFPHVPARKKSFWAADSSHPCPARPAFRSPRLSPAPSVWASLPFRRNPAPLFWAFRLFRRNPAPSVFIIVRPSCRNGGPAWRRLPSPRRSRRRKIRGTSCRKNTARHTPPDRAGNWRSAALSPCG